MNFKFHLAGSKYETTRVVEDYYLVRTKLKTSPSSSSALMEGRKTTGSVGARISQQKPEKPSGYLIYPNPAKDELSIYVDFKNDQADQLTLYNYIGEQIFQQNIAGNITKVSLANVPSGIYICVLKNKNNNVYSQKLLIIK